MDDDRAVRQRLLGELHRVVPFDVHVWLLTDPETEVGSSPLADAPERGDLPRLIRAKYLTAVNRWTSLAAVSVATLAGSTGGELGGSLVWAEVLSGYGVSDVASLVFRDRHGCWGWLDLWRIGGGVFSADEVAKLATRVESITEELRRCQAETFGISTPGGSSRSGPVVLVLSAELAVKAQTPETEGYLRTLVPPGSSSEPAVPAGAFNVAAQLLAREAGIDDHEPSARVHLGDGRWLRLRAARVVGASDSKAADIAVTIEDASPSDRRSLFTRSHGLSPRETDVVEQVSTGADTRTIAAALFVSEHTVQDHLKSIQRKTGCRTRRELVARLTGG